MDKWYNSVSRVGSPSFALAHPSDLAQWRDHARKLLTREVPSDAVVWRSGATPGNLFAGASAPLPATQTAVSVPKPFITRPVTAICHSDPGRFALLYRLAWRLQTQKGLFFDRFRPLAKLRGAPIALDAETTLFVTVHPSCLRPIPDRAKANHERALFATDLGTITAFLENEIGISVALDRARG